MLGSGLRIRVKWKRLEMIILKNDGLKNYLKNTEVLKDILKILKLKK